MAGTLPNFLIIGAMRAGTTSLCRYLEAHPEVFMAPQKEVHFFDLHFARGPGWYEQQFAGARTEQAIGEATQTYMYFDEVPTRLARILPDALLIAVLRNPVDRAYSHYWLERVRGREPLTFADAVAEEPKRLASSGLGARTSHSYLDRGRYLRQLLNVCKYYSREALLVILFEELCDHPDVLFRDVCRFLGVYEDFVPSDVGRVINPFVKFRSLRLRNMLKRLSVGSLIRRAGERLNTRRNVSYPPMDPQLRTVLLKEFEEDNRALESWFGRELTAWNS